MSKYEERVQALSEKYFAAWDMCSPEDDPFEIIARLSVAREAEAVDNALLNNDWEMEDINKYLLLKGLIPPKTETE